MLSFYPKKHNSEHVKTYVFTGPNKYQEWAKLIASCKDTHVITNTGIINGESVFVVRMGKQDNLTPMTFNQVTRVKYAEPKF